MSSPRALNTPAGIDTLALSEDHNPVIIEYKNVESSELINQSLYYLSWIHDRRATFGWRLKQALVRSRQVDWSDVRVICIAPNYRSTISTPSSVMGANIELWTYRLFANGVHCIRGDTSEVGAIRE